MERSKMVGGVSLRNRYGAPPRKGRVGAPRSPLSLLRLSPLRLGWVRAEVPSKAPRLEQDGRVVFSLSSVLVVP